MRECVWEVALSTVTIGILMFADDVNDGCRRRGIAENEEVMNDALIRWGL